MTRLTTSILVSSALRHAQVNGILAAVLRQGDEQAGTIFVEVEIDSVKSSLYGRQVSFDGDYEWVCLTGEVPVSAADVAERLQKETSRDPDCWIICVQDPKGRNIFTIEPDLD
tara:strand:- start:171 stop:509 length:339 start_codon:yes stop_codon:yes gene_type:complete